MSIWNEDNDAYIITGPRLQMNAIFHWPFSFSLSIIHFGLPWHLPDKPIATSNPGSGLCFQQQFGCTPITALKEAVLALSSTSHPAHRSPQGSSPLSQTAPTACPGIPCRWSARPHSERWDGPPGHGPNSPGWRSRSSERPAGGVTVRTFCTFLSILTLCLWLWGITV